LIFANPAPILQHSKQWQEPVESSSFGSDLIAAKIAVKMAKGLRFKLVRIMGVQVYGSMNVAVLCQLIIGKNSMKHKLTLKKQQFAISYRRVHEAQCW
jgi:hypothetical protein